jgi:hypothetical protein
LRAFLALTLVILAGCTAPTQQDGAQRSSVEVGPPAPPPPILLAQSAQGHALVVLGVECCNLTWLNVTIQSGGDDGCGVHAPSSGSIMAGELVQALLPAPDAQCSYSVAYDGLSIGDFLFAPDAPPQETVTVTQAPQPQQNQTQPQGGNGTVPPA